MVSWYRVHWQHVKFWLPFQVLLFPNSATEFGCNAPVFCWTVAVMDTCHFHSDSDMWDWDTVCDSDCDGDSCECCDCALELWQWRVWRLCNGHMSQSLCRRGSSCEQDQQVRHGEKKLLQSGTGKKSPNVRVIIIIRYIWIRKIVRATQVWSCRMTSVHGNAGGLYYVSPWSPMSCKLWAHLVATKA